MIDTSLLWFLNWVGELQPRGEAIPVDRWLAKHWPLAYGHNDVS